ncbi:MAG: Intracellular protease, partial [uncultured Actinomycetospora sp.]
GGRTGRTAGRDHRHQRRGAGGARAAPLRGRRSGRAEHADLALDRPDPGDELRHRQGRHVHPGRRDLRRLGRRLRRAGPARRHDQRRPAASERRRRVVRAGDLRGRQAGRRHLPRAVDARRGRPRARAHADLLSEPAHRHPQRRRRRRRRGGRGGQGPRDQPHTERPRRVLREDRRGVRRGRPQHPRRRGHRGGAL